MVAISDGDDATVWMSPHEDNGRLVGKILISTVARKCISFACGAPAGMEKYTRAICNTRQLFPFSMKLCTDGKDKRTSHGDAIPG